MALIPPRLQALLTIRHYFQAGQQHSLCGVARWVSESYPNPETAREAGEWRLFFMSQVYPYHSLEGWLRVTHPSAPREDHRYMRQLRLAWLDYLIKENS